MTRRALTLLLASVLALGLGAGAAFTTVPYVALKPGPTCNTLGACYGEKVLSFTGATPQQRDGALQLTTVSVQDRLTLIQALVGWLSPSDAVLPREIVFAPDKTDQQNQQQNAEEMTQSQDSASTAALSYLGYKGTTKVLAQAITKGAPAEGRLKAGDQLLTVDGRPVTSEAQLRSLISARSAGQPVTIGYVRGGVKGSVTITTAAAPDKTKRAIVGVTPIVQTDFPVKVDIRLRDVGGPSAGLMFALGIVDELGKVDLTGGLNVAGTGEITAEGQVGAIGGIAQKMRGAKARGATVFLSPADNCVEAKKTKPSGLLLIKVTTLASAVDALTALRNHATPPSC